MNLNHGRDSGLVNILSFKISRGANVCRCRDFEVGALGQYSEDEI